jgi:hypothetical protein
MKILYSPQVNTKDTLEYLFESDKITVTYNGEVDVFDFTDMPDGRVNSYDRRNELIVTTLPTCPIYEAVKQDGVLSVVLLKFIGEEATEEERFPTWIEV